MPHTMTNDSTENWPTSDPNRNNPTTQNGTKGTECAKRAQAYTTLKMMCCTGPLSFFRFPGIMAYLQLAIQHGIYKEFCLKSQNLHLVPSPTLSLTFFFNSSKPCL